MPTWVTKRVQYSALDRECFKDASRVDQQFCLPTPFPERVFSSALDDCSRAARLSKGRNERVNNLANLLTIRWIKQNHPDAWIWDERYHFAKPSIPDPAQAFAQQKFLQLFGDKNLQAIEVTAKLVGLTLTYRMKGRPDLAVFLPGNDPQWRFIEAKIIENRDELKPWQAVWLEIIAAVLGPDSAVHLELVRTP